MDPSEREKVAVTCARLRAATDRLCNLLMGILDDGDVLEIGRRDADREEIGVLVVAALGELNDVCVGSNLRLDRLTSLTVMLSNERGSVKLKPKMLRIWLDQQGVSSGSQRSGEKVEGSRLKGCSFSKLNDPDNPPPSPMFEESGVAA